MNKVLFMSPFIDQISKGKVFSKIFTNVLRVIAVIAGIAGIVGWILMWKLVFEIPAAGVVGGIIYQLIFAVLIYMVVHAILIRANHISKIADGGYPVIPVVSVFFKLLGEVYASFAAAVSVGGGILIWFAGRYSYDLLKPVSPFLLKHVGGEAFLGGLLYILVGVVFAFFVLVGFYLLSELFVAVINIAKNTTGLQKAVAPRAAPRARR